MITKHIHQTWKTHQIPEKYVKYVEQLKTIHKDWKYTLWSDEDNTLLIKQHYPDFFEAYAKIQLPIVKADFARYAFIHQFGGYYLDLDLEIIKKIDTLHDVNINLLLTEEHPEHAQHHGVDLIITNWFFGAQKGHPFLYHLMEEIIKSDLNENVLEQSGPLLVTNIFNNHTKKYTKVLSFEKLNPLSKWDCWEGKINYDIIEYGLHHYDGNWWRKKEEQMSEENIQLKQFPEIDLISCLMITRQRPKYLERAIECYKNQIYSNKELVIVYESDDEETIQLLKNYNEADILKIEIPIQPKLTLGALRNIAIRECNGTYFTQWDDDDYSSKDRIKEQYQWLKNTNKKACLLKRWLLFDETTSLGYISFDIDIIGGGENTILCEKAFIMEHKNFYPELIKGEDTPFIQYLKKQNEITLLDEPRLYIYSATNCNTWERQHFEDIIEKSCMPLPSELNNKLKRMLELE